VEDTWSRIESWLSIHAVAVLQSLHSGASPDELLQSEQFLGLALPDDVKASYRIHDGQEPGGFGLIDCWELLSLERMREEWSVWKDLLDGGDFADVSSSPDPAIRDDWWNPRWIPLTYSGSGDHHCLDLDPAPGGTLGQIILMWHDDATRTLVAPDFRRWLRVFANDLEAGTYVYSEEYGGLIDKSELA
jgi:cell wall assembly regulator SMI1